jgi:hypothetical protein
MNKGGFRDIKKGVFRGIKKGGFRHTEKGGFRNPTRSSWRLDLDMGIYEVRSPRPTEVRPPRRREVRPPRGRGSAASEANGSKAPGETRKCGLREKREVRSLSYWRPWATKLGPFFAAEMPSSLFWISIPISVRLELF